MSFSRINKNVFTNIAILLILSGSFKSTESFHHLKFILSEVILLKTKTVNISHLCYTVTDYISGLIISSLTVSLNWILDNSVFPWLLELHFAERKIFYAEENFLKGQI